MTKFKILITSLLLTFFAGMSFCQSLKPATEDQKREIISQIITSAKNTNSLECKFIQKKNISILSEDFVSEGIMCFKKDNNLRWQYNKPYPFIFILSGNNVMIINDKRTDRFDTNSNKMFKEISEIMIGSVSGNILINNTKFTTQYLSGTNSAQIKFEPKNKDLKQMFSMIVLTFCKSDWQVKSIEMVEPGGDNTLITFNEKNVNTKISDDMFRVN